MRYRTHRGEKLSEIGIGCYSLSGAYGKVEVCTLLAHTEAYDDPGRADDPVTAITWYQAVDYAGWVGGRFPTEVEWEAACAGPYGLGGTAGEVWEWTSSLGYWRYPYDAADGREDA